MTVSTFRGLQKQLIDTTIERYGQRPYDAIFVFVDKQQHMHILQDNGTPNLYRALREKKKMLLGAIGFTKVLVGSQLCDRATRIVTGPKEFEVEIGAMLGAAAKTWVKIPDGTPEGIVPVAVSLKDADGGMVSL